MYKQNAGIHGDFNLVLTAVQLQATQQMYQLGRDLQLTAWNIYKSTQAIGHYHNTHLNAPFSKTPLLLHK